MPIVLELSRLGCPGFVIETVPKTDTCANIDLRQSLQRHYGNVHLHTKIV